jgi:hypothetical protein
MPLRPPAGFIRPGFDPLKNPNAPTGVSATAGSESASVSFTPPANVGGSAISQYQVLAYTGGTYLSNTAGAAPPVNVTGLSNGTEYTFQVWALNSYGPGPFSAMSGGVTPDGIRALVAAGSTNTNSIEYFAIATTGNALDFGDLSASLTGPAPASSSTRAVFMGGGNSSSTINNMSYVTILTTGDAVDFGSLTTTVFIAAGISNETRGIRSGGNTNYSDNFTNVIDYITIASTGNATDFGDMLSPTGYLYNGVGSSTRGITAGGFIASQNINVIQYITIATTGNALDFGDLLFVCANVAACSSSTRAVFAGGAGNSGRVNVISYVTIASTGNAIDFGDLIVATSNMGGTSNKTRGVFSGGSVNAGSGRTNVISYVTIASAGDALDFGDLLTDAHQTPAAASNAHGGL